MTIIKNKKIRFGCDISSAKPILEILVAKDKKFIEKFLLKLKKRKKIENRNIK